MVVNVVIDHKENNWFPYGQTCCVTVHDPLTITVWPEIESKQSFVPQVIANNDNLKQCMEPTGRPGTDRDGGYREQQRGGNTYFTRCTNLCCTTATLSMQLPSLIDLFFIPVPPPPSVYFMLTGEALNHTAGHAHTEHLTAAEERLINDTKAATHVRSGCDWSSSQEI